jgi:hypothetical protein
MIARATLVIAVVAVLAACDAPAPRVDSAGQSARAEVDALTKQYTGCVEGHAGAIPLPQQPAGSIAPDIMKTCREARTALFRKVAAFDRIGHPKHSAAMAEAVAQASVATLDDELRQGAVVAIIKRQQAAGPITLQGNKT